MTFNLRSEVVSVLAESSLSDPGEIADKVAESIPGKALRSCLRVTLRAFVREVIRAQRDSQTSGSGHLAHDSQRPPAAAGTKPAHSWKRDAIRDAWRQHLADRYHVDGTWKRLSEMTFGDLLTAANEREVIAEQNAARAERLREWAGLLEKHKAATFGDLPVAIQAEALS